VNNFYEKSIYKSENNLAALRLCVKIPPPSVPLQRQNHAGQNHGEGTESWLDRIRQDKVRVRNSLNREPREPREKSRPARGHAAFACLVYFAVYPVFRIGTGFEFPCPECEQKATNCPSSFALFASLPKKCAWGRQN